MAHEVETAIYANKPAWHGLGVVFNEKAEDRFLHSDEAIKLGGLDWDVELVPIEFNGEETGYNLVVRDADDKVFAAVGPQYQPIQNRQGFAMLDQLIDAGDLKIESAMSLREGKTVVIVARRPEEILIAGEEHIPYIMCALYHDGTGAAKFLTTPTRVVCANTLAVALDHAQQSYSVRHTINADIRLAEARHALQISYKFTDEFVVMGEELVQAKITDRQLDKFLKSLVEDEKDDGDIKRRNNEREREGIKEVYKTADNLGNIRGTKWGAFNAVAEYNQHHKSYRDPERRLLATMDRQTTDQKALKLLTA